MKKLEKFYYQCVYIIRVIQVKLWMKQPHKKPITDKFIASKVLSLMQNIKVPSTVPWIMPLLLGYKPSLIPFLAMLLTIMFIEFWIIKRLCYKSLFTREGLIKIHTLGRLRHNRKYVRLYALFIVLGMFGHMLIGVVFFVLMSNR